MMDKVRARISHARYVLKQQGVSALLRLVSKQIKRKAGHYAPGMYDFGYTQWLKSQSLNSETCHHNQRPVISILVPVYNVEETWLNEMIESVVAQTYPHWELCMVNDCATDPHVATVLDQFAMSDQRIKVHHNASNMGIAATSNQALTLATGEYIALLDHDDLLTTDALDNIVQAINRQPEADLFYSDEDKVDTSGVQQSPFFKPDFSPALLLSQNYFGHLVVLSSKLMHLIGGFKTGFDGAQDYDLILRATEQASEIVHIPKVLYHWRKIQGSTATLFGEKDYAWDAGKKALQDYLDRRDDEGVAERGAIPGTYRVRYPIVGKPLVTILIPFRDQPELLDQCLHSLLEHTQWPHLEVLGIDNQSNSPDTVAVKEKWLETDPRIRFIDYHEPFNFSAICNFGVREAAGRYIVLMNNDIAIYSDSWLENMLQYAQQQTTGAVGAQLLYPDGHIQHAGIVIGIGQSAGHPFKHFSQAEVGYFGRLKITSNVSAVTAALLMVSTEKYLEAGGLDETEFSVALNDVDFCLKLLDLGYLNVVTSDVRATHHESKTRGLDSSSAGAERLAKEAAAFQLKWQRRLTAGDPYYNPNLTLDSEDYRLRGL